MISIRKSYIPVINIKNIPLPSYLSKNIKYKKVNIISKKKYKRNFVPYSNLAARPRAVFNASRYASMIKTKYTINDILSITAIPQEHL
jgi:hypothetical protein